MNSLRLISALSMELRKASNLMIYSRTISSLYGHNSFHYCFQNETKRPFLKLSFHTSHLFCKETQEESKLVNEVIKLLGVNGESRGIMKFRKAEQLAKQEQAKLQLVKEMSNDHPVYQLVLTKDLGLEKKELNPVKNMDRTKSSKSVKLSSTIAVHDLGIKSKQIAEWLGKGLEVKVSIKSGCSTEGENQVFDQITAACKDLGMIKNSKKTATELIFQLSPKSQVSPTATDQNLKPLKLGELKKLHNAEEISVTNAPPKK